MCLLLRSNRLITHIFNTTFLNLFHFLMDKIKFCPFSFLINIPFYLKICNEYEEMNLGIAG